jgi:response regulator of citrate/malate metabolism
MSTYKDLVFKTIMLSQGVENLTRDCILKSVANGELSPSDKELEKIKNHYGLGGLSYAIKPCITNDLFERLFSFSKDRNELAHKSADLYLKHQFSSMSDDALSKELWKLSEVKIIAGDLFGELLDLHADFTK